MTRKLTEAEIEQVVQETGMGHLQAHRHLTQRYQIQADLQRNPPKYPLGKSAYDMGDRADYCPFNTINS